MCWGSSRKVESCDEFWEPTMWSWGLSAAKGLYSLKNNLVLSEISLIDTLDFFFLCSKTHSKSFCSITGYFHPFLDFFSQNNFELHRPNISWYTSSQNLHWFHILGSFNAIRAILRFSSDEGFQFSLEKSVFRGVVASLELWVSWVWTIWPWMSCKGNWETFWCPRARFNRTIAWLVIPFPIFICTLLSFN